MEQYRKLSADLAASQASLEAQKKRLSEIEASEAELKTLRESVKTAKTEFAEWDLLRRAFGPDGIQALELDALAPGIAEVANDILAGAYGDRFKISFETTRIGGTGKKSHQIEDFLIYVTDSQDGDMRLLDYLSGGEAVWVKRAIYDAFSFIRRKNTGLLFKTAFQDEADGALDAESKISYARMLESAHYENKMRHTIIITHSDSVKALISQTIDMEAL
jgi:exonuclease SbcC